MPDTRATAAHLTPPGSFDIDHDVREAVDRLCDTGKSPNDLLALAQNVTTWGELDRALRGWHRQQYLAAWKLLHLCGLNVWQDEPALASPDTIVEIAQRLQLLALLSFSQAGVKARAANKPGFDPIVEALKPHRANGCTAWQSFKRLRKAPWKTPDGHYTVSAIGKTRSDGRVTQVNNGTGRKRDISFKTLETRLWSKAK